MESGDLSVAVSTVDGYQGREADAVVLSAVRWGAEHCVRHTCLPRARLVSSWASPMPLLCHAF